MSSTNTDPAVVTEPTSPMPVSTPSTADTTEGAQSNDNAPPVDYNILGKPLPPKTTANAPVATPASEPYDPHNPPLNENGMPLDENGHLILDPDLAAIVRRGDDLGHTTRFEFNSLVDILQTTRGPPTIEGAPPVEPPPEEPTTEHTPEETPAAGTLPADTVGGAFR